MDKSTKKIEEFDRICTKCGKLFKTKNKLYGKSNYCSDKCKVSHKKYNADQKKRLKKFIDKRREKFSNKNLDKSKSKYKYATDKITDLDISDFDDSISIDKVFANNEGKCTYCGVDCSWEGGPSSDTYPNIEHIIPLCRGGNHTYDNVTLSCVKCNTEKGIMTDYEFRKMRENYSIKIKKLGGNDE